jgi:dTDP-4-amino-4,6-dideoxygalactose transaminase
MTDSLHVANRWKVPFMRPDLPTYADVSPAIAAAFAAGMLTKGGQLQAFEEDVAACVGTAEAVGVSSCTTGLMLVLRSLAMLRSQSTACPIGSACVTPAGGQAVRDEVIVPSFIFLAAPAAIVWAGLRPVFVDVDPQTYTLVPGAVQAAISPRTCAILACHTFGCPCDVDGLTAVGERAGLPLIVDAAHGFGATRAGWQVGRGGLAQVFSLSPTKLVVAGEGGVVATSCACLANIVRTAREYGNDGRYGCDHAGLNGRIPEISAIIGRASLARLPEVAARRRAVALAYRESLADVAGIGFQRIPDGCESSWKDFCISIDADVAGITRDELMRALAERGIDTRAYYSPACHRMEAFRQFSPTGTLLPVTDRLAASLVALPMGGHLTPDIAREVAAEVRLIMSNRTESVHGRPF